MEAIAIDEKLFTVEEYIQFEEESDIRHEFYLGQLYPISSESTKHNHIKQNIVYALRDVFLNRNYLVFDESLKLELIKNKHYNYPDILLTSNTQDIESEYIIRYPSLIVEVISKSTEDRDRRDKLQSYRELPSTQYYLLVDSRHQYVDLFSRTETENLWTYQHFFKITDIVSFPKLDFKMPISTIYEGVIN